MEGQEPDYENNAMDEETDSSVDMSENEVLDDTENDSWVDMSENERLDDSENDIADSHNEGKRYSTFQVVPSLQNTCLLCISDHFDRFNCANSISHDDELRRQLLFLQRKHSGYLLSVKSVDGYLDQSYFNFLVNENLKELDVKAISRCNRKDVLKRIAEVGHGFEKVSFHDVTPCKDSLKFGNEIICHVHNVKLLNLCNFCNDQILKSIADSCPMLEELDIDWSKVTTNGLKFLCPELGGVAQPKLANLRVLSMRFLPNTNKVDVKDCIKSLLRNVPSLEVLDHSQLPHALHSLYLEDMDKNVVVDNMKKFNISSLDLCDKTSVDLLKAITVTCPHLKVMRILVCHVDQVDLLSHFTKLEQLYFKNGSHYLNLNSVLKITGKGLKTLSICELDIAIPVLIQCCPNLKSLSLIGATYQSVPKNNTAILYNLSELHVEEKQRSNSVSFKAVVQLLNSSPNLEKISMKNCDLSESGDFKTIFSQCYENSVLKNVTFDCCDVDETILESVLLTSSFLQTLTIENCDGIDNTIIHHLRHTAQTIRKGIDIIYYELSEFSNSDDYNAVYDEIVDSDDFY